MKRIRIAQLALVLAAAACDKPAPPPADSAAATPPVPTPAVTPPADAAPSTFRVRLETSKGPIVVELTREWAPNGVDRFYQLVEAGYYDDVRFFRVVPGFVVQFGMHGNPTTNSEWVAKPLADDPVKQSNKRGTLTFAQTAMPNSRTTQLFINLADNSALDGQRFAPIGTVVEGMSVVDALYAGYGGAPSDQQPQIAAEGNAFLTRTYPKLDFIRTAKVVK